MKDLESEEKIAIDIAKLERNLKQVEDIKFEGKEKEVYDRAVDYWNDSIQKEGQVMISGGTINVAGIPSIATHGTITEDDHVNILSGGDITMNGGVMNIQDGALLSVRNGFDDETYGDTSTS